LNSIFQEKDVVRNGINNGAQKLFDQLSLTDEEGEQQEDDADDVDGDAINVILRRNERVEDGSPRIRVRFEQDTSDEDLAFTTVVQRNETLLKSVKRLTVVKNVPDNMQSTSNALIGAESEYDYDDNNEDDADAMKRYYDALAVLESFSIQEGPTTETYRIGKYIV
jgi:hypothetical protein